MLSRRILGNLVEIGDTDRVGKLAEPQEIDFQYSGQGDQFRNTIY